MANTLFIGEQYIKDITPICNNVDIEQVTPHIEYAQDAFIQDLLGTNFYINLQAEYAAASLTGSSYSLVQLIKPALAYRSAEQAVAFLNVQIRNKGLNLLNSENAQQAEVERAKYIEAKLAGRADYYTEQIQKYLVRNGNDFIDYIDPGEEDGPVVANRYESDIYFDDYCGCNTPCNCNRNSLI